MARKSKHFGEGVLGTWRAFRSFRMSGTLPKYLLTAPCRNRTYNPLIKR